MTDISFDDFVNQQIAKTKPSVDWTQRRDAWRKHLDEFYQLAEGFLQKYIDQDKIHITWSTKQINEEYIGIYEVVANASQGKLFNPEGLWDQTKPITSQDIAEVRKEMWHKFDQKIKEDQS